MNTCNADRVMSAVTGFVLKKLKNKFLVMSFFLTRNAKMSTKD